MPQTPRKKDVTTQSQNFFEDPSVLGIDSRYKSKHNLLAEDTKSKSGRNLHQLQFLGSKRYQPKKTSAAKGKLQVQVNINPSRVSQLSKRESLLLMGVNTESHYTMQEKYGG